MRLFNWIKKQLYGDYEIPAARDWDDFVQRLSDQKAVRVTAKCYKRGEWYVGYSPIEGLHWGTKYIGLTPGGLITYEESYDNFIIQLVKSNGGSNALVSAYLITTITADTRLTELERRAPTLIKTTLKYNKKIFTIPDKAILYAVARQYGIRPIPLQGK